MEAFSKILFYKYVLKHPLQCCRETLHCFFSRGTFAVSTTSTHNHTHRTTGQNILESKRFQHWLGTFSNDIREYFQQPHLRIHLKNFIYTCKTCSRMMDASQGFRILSSVACPWTCAFDEAIKHLYRPAN